MQIKSALQGEIPIIAPCGRLDAHGTSVFEKTAYSILRNKPSTIIINLKNVDYLSSAGIRVLLALHRKLEADGAILILASIQPFPLEVLTMTGFTKRLCIVETLDEAIKLGQEKCSQTRNARCWDALPRYQAAGVSFRFLDQTNKLANIELLGKLPNIIQGQCKLNDVTLERFHATDYSFGLGYPGDDNSASTEFLGPFVTANKALGWHPICEPRNADVLLLEGEGASIPGCVLYRVAFNGHPGKIAVVQAPSNCPDPTMGMLYQAIIKLLKDNTSFKGIIGCFMMARLTGPSCARMTELPFAEGACPAGNARRWLLPEKDTQLLGSKNETGVMALITSVVTDLTTEYPHSDRSKLDDLFFLHPAHIQGKQVLAQSYAMLFSDSNWQPRNTDLSHTISTMINENRFLDVAMLLPETTFSEALLQLYIIDEVQRKSESQLHVEFSNKADSLSPTREQLTRQVFADCSEVKLKLLSGGYSGSQVAQVDSWDTRHRKQMPLILKVGDKAELLREIDAFNIYVKKFILNNATSLMKYSIGEHEGALIYNFVGLSGNDAQIVSLDDYYHTAKEQEIIHVIDSLFRGVLKPWYRQPLYAELPLYQEYDFQANKRLILQGARDILHVDDKAKYFTVPHIQRRFINPLYLLSNVMPMVTETEFPAYQCIVHGDLNTRNVLLEDNSHVWVIDFSETHEGHNLKDLAKMETVFKFESVPVDTWEKLDQWLSYEQSLTSLSSLNQMPPPSLVPDYPQAHKLHQVTAKLRSLANELTLLETSTTQYNAALLYFTLQVLYYQQVPSLVKWYALCSAAMLCGQLPGLTIEPEGTRKHGNHLISGVEDDS